MRSKEKMKYAITGSNDDLFKLPQFMSYCWENYFHLFPKKSSGLYVGREKVFANNRILDHLDIWICELGQWYTQDHYRVAATYAKSKGVKTIACIHSPWIMTIGAFHEYVNMNIKNLQAFDGLILHYHDQEMADWISEVTERPVIPIVPPPEREMIEQSYEAMPIELPFEAGTYCLVANPLLEDLDRRTDFLFYWCKKLDIPFIVNNARKGEDPRYDMYFSYIKERYGSLAAEIPKMSTEQWYWVVRNSLFTSVASLLPTLGRPILDAAMCETLSIGVASAWQQILYPECIIPYRPESHVEVQQAIFDRHNHVERAVRSLKAYDVPAESERFLKWIQSI